LWNLVEEVGTIDLWRRYAWLGMDQTLQALEKHPELKLVLAEPLLHYCPDRGIDVLLDFAADPVRPTEERSNALKRIQSWLREGRNGALMAHRSEQLVRQVCAWRKEHPASEACSVALSALFAAMAPGFEQESYDPGQGRTLIITNGILRRREQDRLAALWPRVAEMLRLAESVPWQSMFHLLDAWLHPNPMASPDRELVAAMESVGRTMLLDMAASTTWHAGVQRRIAEIALRLKIEISCSIPEDFLALFPLGGVSTSDDWQLALRQRDAQVEELSIRLCGRQPDDLTELLASFEALAKEAALQSSGLGVLVCERIAARTDTPHKYVHSFCERGLGPELVRPFASAMVGQPTFRQCVLALAKSQAYAPLALELAVRAPDLSSDALESCLAAVPNPSGIIEACGRLASEETLRQLLTHRSDTVAVSAALGESGHQDSSNVRLPEEWRAAIVRSANVYASNPLHEYYLERILRRDLALASDWLRALAGTEAASYGNEEIAKRLVGILDEQQRLRFLESVREACGLDEVVAAAVGDNTRVYEHLLAQPLSRECHLYPLLGPPAGAWGDKVAMALARGYAEEAILRAVFPNHWGFTGLESSYWESWALAFEKFTGHLNPTVRRIAQRGLDDVRERIEDSKRREHVKAVRGLIDD
jgi:hypothetical protein